MKRMTTRLRSLGRRLGAAGLAAGTLWAVTVTAGSETAAGAWKALRESSPMGALRWELGELWVRDTLSPAAVLTLGESPLLLSARTAVAELWSTERAESAGDGEEEELVTTPVEETPLDAADAVDNGIPARTLVPTDPSGYTVCGRAYISNTTDHTLDVTALTDTFDAELTDEGPQILILHSHGSEAYSQNDGDLYQESDAYRTTDCTHNVVRVGEAMAEVFRSQGLQVIHDTNLYDYPAYNGSYDRSKAAVRDWLAKYPTIRIILDVHRDALVGSDGSIYKLVTQENGKKTAQVMLVVGTDGGGAQHPYWIDNLALAVRFQQELVSDYVSLARPIVLRNSSYNQQLSPGYLLVEVGGHGNTLTEAVDGARLFAQSVSQVLNTMWVK